MPGKARVVRGKRGASFYGPVPLSAKGKKSVGLASNYAERRNGSGSMTGLSGARISGAAAPRYSRRFGKRETSSLNVSRTQRPFIHFLSDSITSTLVIGLTLIALIYATHQSGGLSSHAKGFQIPVTRTVEA